ncbi:Exosome complex component csl4 [Diplonema papillatum]|nr:Exosome complex component csl4 [Diplonema papillatum]
MPKVQKAGKLTAGVPSAGRFVVPGDRLLDAEGKSPLTGGEGTARLGTHLLATIAGYAQFDKGVFCVKRKGKSSPTPAVGAIVLGTVAKVGGNFANIDIFCINKKRCHTTFKGTLRVEDTRAVFQSLDTLKQVEMWRNVKPNDVVRAEVIGLGDRKAYQLSVLRDELGVVFGNSIDGHQLVAMGADTMQCIGTGRVEERKVSLGGSDFWWL